MTRQHTQNQYGIREARAASTRLGALRSLAGRAAAIRRLGMPWLLMLLALPATGQQSGDGQNPSYELPPRDGAVIHGRVVDAEGAPVFGLGVFTVRTGAPTDTTPLVIARSESRIDGYFNLTGLPPGTYQVCIEAYGKEYLNPCEWSEAPVTVQLEENGVVHDLDIPVESGETVLIEVEDPADSLGRLTDAAERAAKPSGSLIVGVRTRTGNLSRARLQLRDREAKKLRYAVQAPAGEDLELLLMPVNVDLETKDRQRLNERGSTIQVTREERDEKPKDEPLLSLSVAGKVAP